MRILLAPHEIAGQMRVLAETFRSMGVQATSVSYHNPQEHPFSYINDINIGFRAGSCRLSRLLDVAPVFLLAARRFDVIHFFYGDSLIPRFRWDVPLLRALGKRIVVHFHGSDIRDPKYYNQEAGMPRHRDDPGFSLQSTPAQVKKIEFWRKYAHAILVSTRDLLALVPEAIWVPQAVDLRRIPLALKPLSPGETVRIAHAPSKRAEKGTDYVIRAVESLKREGLAVELVLVEKTPHDKVWDIFRTCHLGIDRLFLGWYGTVSVELMAIGRPVICYIAPKLRVDFPELPLITAGVEDLSDVIVEVISCSEQWASWAEKGRAYVEEYHDAGKIAAQLLEIYSSC
jgi:glycosyltransferase involved in cell wall biosynthesis